MNAADLINSTIAYIQQKHGNQKDKVGRAYWHHPVAVMELIPDPTLDEMLAALLHDIVEDTSTTFEDLVGAGYSEKVIEMIRLLTRDKQNETYKQYIQRLVDSQNWSAMRVKLADLKHNMSPTRHDLLPEGEAKRLMKRYRWASDLIIRSLEASCGY